MREIEWGGQDFFLNWKTQPNESEYRRSACKIREFVFAKCSGNTKNKMYFYLFLYILGFNHMTCLLRKESIITL